MTTAPLQWKKQQSNRQVAYQDQKAETRFGTVVQSEQKAERMYILNSNNGQLLHSTNQSAKQKLNALPHTSHAHNYIHVHTIIYGHKNGLPRFVKRHA